MQRPTDIGINQKLSLTPQNGMSESPVTPSYPIAPSEKISYTNGSVNIKDKVNKQWHLSLLLMQQGLFSKFATQCFTR